jgi:hypothetical protein
MFMFMFVYVYVCLYLCLFMSLFMFMFIFVYVYVYVYVALLGVLTFFRKENFSPYIRTKVCTKWSHNRENSQHWLRTRLRFVRNLLRY